MICHQTKPNQTCISIDLCCSLAGTTDWFFRLIISDSLRSVFIVSDFPYIPVRNLWYANMTVSISCSLFANPCSAEVSDLDTKTTLLFCKIAALNPLLKVLIWMVIAFVGSKYINYSFVEKGFHLLEGLFVVHRSCVFP